jgi:hypothetical protein
MVIIVIIMTVGKNEGSLDTETADSESATAVIRGNTDKDEMQAISGILPFLYNLRKVICHKIVRF